jgi:transposase
VLQQTKEARVFRRAPAVRAVVAGHPVHAVSPTCRCTASALRKWGQRFASEGAQGLLDRPRPGRPRQVTCALAKPLNRLVDHDPLPHGSRSSPWSGRELAPVLAQHTGVQSGRDSVRLTFKKTRGVPVGLPAHWSQPWPPWPRRTCTWRPWSGGRVRARAACSRKTRPSCGALPCLVEAGGAGPSAPACRPGPSARARATATRRSSAKRGRRSAPGVASPAGGCSQFLAPGSLGPLGSAIQLSPILRRRNAATISIK